MVERFFLKMPWGCLRFVIVVFPDHTHLLFLACIKQELVLKTNFDLLFEWPLKVLLYLPLHTVVIILLRKLGGTNQESIQSNTTPDPGHHMGK